MDMIPLEMNEIVDDRVNRPVGSDGLVHDNTLATMACRFIDRCT